MGTTAALVSSSPQATIEGDGSALHPTLDRRFAGGDHGAANPQNGDIAIGFFPASPRGGFAQRRLWPLAAWGRHFAGHDKLRRRRMALAQARGLGVFSRSPAEEYRLGIAIGLEEAARILRNAKTSTP